MKHVLQRILQSQVLHQINQYFSPFWLNTQFGKTVGIYNEHYLTIIHWV